MSSLQVEASEQAEAKILSEEADSDIHEAKECAKSATDNSYEKNTIEIKTISFRRNVDREFGKTILECSGPAGSDELVSAEGVRDALEHEIAEGVELAKDLKGLRKKKSTVDGRGAFQGAARKIWTGAKVAVAQTTKSEHEASFDDVRFVARRPALPSSRPRARPIIGSSAATPKRKSGKGRSSRGRRIE